MVEIEELKRATEQRLIALLTIELDLGFAFARLGAQQWEAIGRERSRQSAQDAVTITRHFEGTISDARDWWQIHERADELDRLLLAFTNRAAIPASSN
jgi:hypothetical protein